jgi:selenocysteine lyase/cysteine desulfurase
MFHLFYVLFMLICQKHLFSLPESVHYINCAYMSPMMKRVEEAGIAGIRAKSLPHLVKPADFFPDVHRLRQAFAALVGAASHESIALIPSVSYGMSIVERNLHHNPNSKRGGNIVLLQDEFPSVVYPCHRMAEQHGLEVRTVAAPKRDAERGKRWNEALLETIDRSTTLVALSGVHWTDGTRFDMLALRKRTRDVGALLVIDGTQFVGGMPFDAQHIQPDALIAGSYKWMMGPYSIGAAYLGEFFADGVPNEEGWLNRLGSEDFSRLVEYQREYQPGMMRYSVGEQSNFVLVPMFLAAVEQLLEWGVHEVESYIQHLTAELFAELGTLGCTVEDEAWRSKHLCGVRLPKGVNVRRVQEQLAARNVYVSVRGDAVRISPNVYNDARDIEAFIDALREAL